MRGRLRWTDANQLPRQSKVMDRENEKEIYFTSGVREGRKSGTVATTGKGREIQIERERLYRVFRKSIQPAARVFNELCSLVI